MFPFQQKLLNCATYRSCSLLIFAVQLFCCWKCVGAADAQLFCCCPVQAARVERLLHLWLLSAVEPCRCSWYSIAFTVQFSITKRRGYQTSMNNSRKLSKSGFSTVLNVTDKKIWLVVC